MEPDVSIDADDFACVLFDVCVDLDGFQQREKTRDSHCRKYANKCRVDSNSFKMLNIDAEKSEIESCRRVAGCALSL